MENPFYKDYDTPFEIPPFSEIEESHFIPAFLKGMEEHNNDISDIISNSEKPSFENVIIAMERSGTLLDKVSSVFYNLSGSTTNPKIQEIEKEISPKLSEHFDSISLNSDIFKKVKVLWEDIDNLDLSKEEKKILEETYKRFVRNGALLEGSEKERYADINQEITKLSVQFSQNLLAETNEFEIILD
ncbi:MAG: peptidase M3, partial [Pseudomonadota bacterium]|nr:peptidase M3 [Pseudomonadota bacterium]